MNILTYVNKSKNEVIRLHFGSLSGVFARRCEDGRWVCCQVQYQPESQGLVQNMWRIDAPALFHPATGEKLVAMRGANCFRAFVEAGTPDEALAAFEAVIPRHYRSRPAPPAPALME